MNDVDIRAILDLGARRKSDDEFLRTFRGGVLQEEVAKELLEEAVMHRDPGEVALAMTVGHRFGFSTIHGAVLEQLALAPWHYMHEDLVHILQGLAEADFVDCLVHLTRWLPPNEDEQERFLAVQAIWALGAIRGEEAKRALESLARSKNAAMKECAEMQLARRPPGEGGAAS